MFSFFEKFVILGSFECIFVEGNMKYRSLLFVSFCLLTGCYYQNAEQGGSSDSLRAPVYQSYREGSANHSGANMPQSVTTPMNINPVPTQTVTQTAQQQATQPTQPLVQTIVIPQYTPQPAVLPYAQYGAQVQPFNNAQQITIPAQSVVAPSTPVVQPQQISTAYSATPASVSVPKPVIKKEVSVSQKTAAVQQKERVYPSWAAADFTPAQSNSNNDVVYFKNPNRNETVQCAAVDVMCIASYQQQGYTQTQGNTAVKPVPVRAEKNTSGYPDTEWDDNTIPRW